MTLLRWLYFWLKFLTVTVTVLLFWIYWFLLMLVFLLQCSTIPPLGNSDHVVVSVSFDFLSNSKQDALFHCIVYDYSCADWNSLFDHWRISLNSVLLLLLVNFVSGFRLELMYISLIISERSSLTHFHVF